MQRRRWVLATTVAAGLALTAISIPAQAAPADPGDALTITVVATTDLHDSILNYDYYAGRDFTGNNIQGAALTTASIEAVRAGAADPESVFVFDNGDTIQGNPMGSLYGVGAMRQPILDNTTIHPMAQVFKDAEYDAVNTGNHEYNYGVDFLDAWAGQVEGSGIPVLAANVLDHGTTNSHFVPYTVINRVVTTPAGPKDVRVGVLGIVTPNVRVWDQLNVDGVLDFQDQVTAARRWVPQLRDTENVDVVVALVHSGLNSEASPDTYDATALYENAADSVAQLVPGIDLVVYGHTHQDVPQKVVTNTAGQQVMMTQPYYHGRSASQVTMNLVYDAAASGVNHWKVDWTDGNAPTATGLYSKNVAAPSTVVTTDPVIVNADQMTRDSVQEVIGQNTQEMTTDTSRYEDTPILDLINQVQTEAVASYLAGSQYANLPIISEASPFSRTSVFPQGDVTVANVAGLYIYDNTLFAKLLTGAELKAYLEDSAKYFAQLPKGATFNPDTDTNAGGTPDYNYDAISGVNYVIDVSEPVGSRIKGLSFPDGTPVADGDRFVLAVNNYRATGGGNFAAVRDAQTLYEGADMVRDLIIDWVKAKGIIDPASIFVKNWELTTDYVPPVPPVDPVAAMDQPLHRFYKADGSHFYTASAYEAQQVKTYAGYSYEGEAGAISQAPVDGLVPLYRFYKVAAGTHFYTTSDYEKSLVATYPEYSYEGIAGYVAPTELTGTTAMHRFYKFAAGTHFYTASAYEAGLVTAYPEYRSEGTSFYLAP